MHGVNRGAHVRQSSCWGRESDMPATVISGHLRVCARKARIKVCRQMGIGASTIASINFDEQ